MAPLGSPGSDRKCWGALWRASSCSSRMLCAEGLKPSPPSSSNLEVCDLLNPPSERQTPASARRAISMSCIEAGLSHLRSGCGQPGPVSGPNQSFPRRPPWAEVQMSACWACPGHLPSLPTAAWGREEERAAHQQQAHGVEPAELLVDAGRVGVQQGRHEAGAVQAGVPEGLLQHADGGQDGGFLQTEHSLTRQPSVTTAHGPGWVHTGTVRGGRRGPSSRVHWLEREGDIQVSAGSAPRGSPSYRGQHPGV